MYSNLNVQRLFMTSEILNYFPKLRFEGYVNVIEVLKTNTEKKIISSLHPKAKQPLNKGSELFVNYLHGLYRKPSMATDSFDSSLEYLLEKRVTCEFIDRTETTAIFYYYYKVFKDGVDFIRLIDLILNYLNNPSDDSQKQYKFENNYLSEKTISLKFIDNVQTFAGEIKELANSTPIGKQIFYRGHSNVNSLLVPSLFRHNNLHANESSLFQEMISRCPDDFMHCKSHFDYLVKMQHYGLPTRLLDITRNPLVALYFACEANKSDGEVVLLSETIEKIKYSESDTVCILSALCKLSNETQGTIHMMAIKISDIDTFNSNEYVKKLLHEIKTVKPGFQETIRPSDLSSFRFVNPLKSNARIVKQDGAFILCGLSENPLKSARHKSCSRLIIRSEDKKKIRKELNTYGINEATMFPEIDRVAQYLKDEYLKTGGRR